MPCSWRRLQGCHVATRAPWLRGFCQRATVPCPRPSATMPRRTARRVPADVWLATRGTGWVTIPPLQRGVTGGRWITSPPRVDHSVAAAEATADRSSPRPARGPPGPRRGGPSVNWLLMFDKLSMGTRERDLVVLVHDFRAVFPDGRARAHHLGARGLRRAGRRLRHVAHGLAPRRARRGPPPRRQAREALACCGRSSPDLRPGARRPRPPGHRLQGNPSTSGVLTMAA